jgi:hypothetical protein
MPDTLTIFRERIETLVVMINSIESNIEPPSGTNTEKNLDDILRRLRAAQGNIAQTESLLTDRSSIDKIVYLMTRAFTNYGEAVGHYKHYRNNQ